MLLDGLIWNVIKYSDMVNNSVNEVDSGKAEIVSWVPFQNDTKGTVAYYKIFTSVISVDL